MIANHILTNARFCSAKRMDYSYALATSTVRVEEVGLCFQEQETWRLETSGHLSVIATIPGFKQEMVVNIITSSAGRMLNKDTAKLNGV